MTEYTPLEREVAAIIADTLDEHTSLDTNRYTSVIWQITEAVIKEVATAERERIIKLLANTPIEFWYEVNYEGLVAFIKGENK